MSGPTALLAKNGIYTPSTTPATTIQPSPAAPQGTAATPTAPLGAAQLLVDSIKSITIKAKLHGAVQTLLVEGMDPAGILDGLRELDPTVEFETNFSSAGGGRYGGKRNDKRATISLILIRKFGADVTGKTPEGEDVTASIWKDKMAEVLGSLPLTDAEKAKVAQGIEGKLNPALVVLEGRGFEMSYWEREKDGVKSLSVSELHTTNSNSSSNAGAAGAGS